jgi:formylglycine-generating enzyme required for sulfatase activity
MVKKLRLFFSITVGLLNFGCVGKPPLFIDLTTAIDKVSVMPAPPGTAPTATAMEMVYVRGGCYQMGDIFDDPEGGSEEKPVHEVCVDSFYLGKYEVTQGQWKSVMGSNPSSDKSCGVNCPVDNVSWSDVQDFLLRLNSSNGGRAYRLPTEAEWEYAARSGGKKEKFSGGNDVASVAWYNENSGGNSHPVGKKASNGLGLYDMSGSVWEWTNDWYESDYYSQSPRTNPAGPGAGVGRVVRGGCRTGEEYNMRTTRRTAYMPDVRKPSLGFRLLKSPSAR